MTSYTGTADSSDFIGIATGVRIPSGVASVTFDINIHDDLLDESDEQFSLTLSNPSNGALSGATTTVIIKDNDADHLRPGEPAGKGDNIINPQYYFRKILKVII